MTRQTKATADKKIEQSGSARMQTESRAGSLGLAGDLMALQVAAGNAAVSNLASTGKAARQTPLQVSQPEDPAEREADRVSEQVMRISDPASGVDSEQEQSIQRDNDSGGTPTLDGTTGQQIESLRGAGKPLSPAVRSFFEGRLGHDFGNVRVHADGQAAESAEVLNARGYTYGQDIVFGAGQYEPTTARGRKLLGHELAHVVQYGRAFSEKTSGQSGQMPIVQRKKKEDDKEKAKEAAREALRATRSLVLDALLQPEAPEAQKALKTADTNDLNQVAQVQLWLREAGYLSEEAANDEFVIRDFQTFKALFQSDQPQIAVNQIPRTLAAYKAFQRYESLKGQLHRHREGDTKKERQKIAMKLRETVRQQIKDYPQKIKSYLEQGSPTPEEKVRVVGRVMAAAARMEFLTGAIFVEGTEKKHKWETGNKSELIKHYSSAGVWCTRFATTIQDMLTGRGTTASGYKLGGANPVYQPDVREAYGGAFVGTRSSEKQSGNPWNDLRKDLAKKKDAPREERKKIADAFFKKHFKPQAGDMMIVRRGSSAIHSFSSKKQSHTTMIERVEDYRLYTIEGNKKSRVTGRPFDLLNPDHVDEIVFIMRESILSIDPTVAYRSDEAKQKAISKKAAARRRQLAATRIWRIALNAYMQAIGLPMRKVNESELLAPLQRINQLLQQYAVLQGYIEPIREGEADVVANMVRWELGPND